VLKGAGFADLGLVGVATDVVVAFLGMDGGNE
jgi:hypothetical protein